ncbi:MAG: hypothetical protein ABJC07_02640 [Acidobacteriota bacterium]
MARRLTIISTAERAPVGEKPGERRRSQRRLSIGRRLNERRNPETLADRDAEELRQANERRGLAQRRRLFDRRSGIRLLDLTNIDLSELDS